MKKHDRILLVLITMPLIASLVSATTNYVGQATQPVSGTVTVTQGTASSLKVDLSGTSANATALKVDGSAVTQPVSAAALPLPSGAATAAKQPALGTAGTPSADVISVQGAASMTALKVDGSAVTQPISGSVGITGGQTIAVTNAGTFAVQSAATVSVPVITKVAATTTSGSLIAANATRKGLEIDTDCANTDGVAINFGASAAVYLSHKILPACSSWQAPAGLVVQTAIQVISNTGTQQVRVIEYP